jgi:hypothetical protein
LAATSAPRWAEKVRARKRWFVTGEHPRARELAGLNPSPDVSWSVSVAKAQHREAEDLAWLDFEEPTTTAEWFENETEWQEHDRFNADEYEHESYHENEDESDQEAEPEWQLSPMFMEAVLEAGEASTALPFQEAETSLAECQFYPPGYEKLIRRRGTKEGEVMDRTEGDRTVNLALQFRDYDVNAYIAGTKSAHSAGLARITEFIQARTAAGANVEVTITGSASRTGTRQFNQNLSEKRARCMAQLLKQSLSPRVRAKTTFNERGEGFEKAMCHGADCELPGYRSVLVSVHAPNRPPKPVPPEPDTWDKYLIRCCTFETISVGEVLIDKLLSQLPGGLPRAVAEKLSPILKKRAEALLKKLLGRLPKIGALMGDLNKLLKFLPVEIIRQKAIFQVKERDKANPRQITLCYDGWGGRLALPVPGTLDDALDEMLKRVPGIGQNDLIRQSLKKVIREELEKLLPRTVTKLLAKLDSTVPGPWKPFDLNRREQLEVFKGPADIFVDVITNISGPGQITLAFDGRKWKNLDLQQRVTLKCESCAGSVIPLQVDGGVGFDLLSVNTGTLAEQGCSFAAEAEAELFDTAGLGAA